jgi:hypothetical protein
MGTNNDCLSGEDWNNIDSTSRDEEEINMATMEEVYVGQINAKMTQLNFRKAYIDNPKSLDQIATHCDGIFLILNQIKEIQKACPAIKMTPTPDDIILEIEQTRNIKATDLAIAAADLNIQKVKAISNEKKKAKLLDEAKMLIIDAINLVKGQEYLDKLDAKMTELNAL